MGEHAPVLPVPQQGQGELQQRQRVALAVEVFEQRVGEALLEHGQAGRGERALHGHAQLGGARRAQGGRAAGQARTEPGIGEQAVERFGRGREDEVHARGAVV
ncbi:hypothetical protein A6A25_00135 [Saccharothrix sp. CB00851]|nr:hypothetical protein [Saccharothrix sp. CB00851]OKI38673.1 hypothetical protein A6A25_00135 [Saccharothrix sp. CB00851]